MSTASSSSGLTSRAAFLLAALLGIATSSSESLLSWTGLLLEAFSSTATGRSF
jgi:hypothetical protein